MIDKSTWKSGRIKDICERGSSNLSLKVIEDNEGEYPIYGASGLIKYVDFYHQESEYIGLVKDGAGVGRVQYLPAYSSIIGTLQYIIPKANYPVKFIGYYLQSLKLERFATGATIPHIYFRDYGECKIKIPPLPTQHQIVAELDTLNSIIDKKKEQLNELDNLAQATFYDMFGDPVENEKGWEVKKLGKVGELGRGVSKNRPRNSPDLLGGDIPLIQTGDIANSELYILSHSQTYSQKGLEQSKLWKKGTLCITIAANIGKTAIMSYDACFPDSVVGFIANEEIIKNVFVHYYFSWIQQDLEDNAPQVAQKNINLKILNNLDIIVPPLPLQSQFAERIKYIEKQKALIQRSIDDVQQLFDYTMDKYFN